MRTIYDISRIGECYYQPQARSGLSRAIENVARGLAATDECDVAFSAISSVAAASGCLELFKEPNRFDGGTFLSTKPVLLANALDNRHQEVTGRIGERSISDLLKNQNRSWKNVTSLNVGPRVKRRILAGSGRALATFPSFNRGWLNDADIFHSSLYPIPKEVTGVQRFLSVYDMIPKLYPQYCVPTQIEFTNRLLASIEKEDWTICISEATKNDLCNHAAVDPERVFVAHLAAEPDLFYPCSDPERIAFIRRHYGIPDGPYILSLNTLEPRKNIAHVVRCFARLIEEEKIADLNLVLAGAKGWLYDDIFKTISGYKSLRGRIIVPGYVPDEHLAPIYSGALAYVFPSVYEGFGLPPLEAMQCGIPVITSNTSSLPEVVGDAGIMVDPTDVDALGNAIIQIYHSSSLRLKMSKQSLERARQFSWHKTVQKTIEAYKVAVSR